MHEKKNGTSVRPQDVVLLSGRRHLGHGLIWAHLGYPGFIRNHFGSSWIVWDHFWLYLGSSGEPSGRRHLTRGIWEHLGEALRGRSPGGASNAFAALELQEFELQEFLGVPLIFACFQRLASPSTVYMYSKAWHIHGWPQMVSRGVHIHKTAALPLAKVPLMCGY